MKDNGSSASTTPIAHMLGLRQKVLLGLFLVLLTTAALILVHRSVLGTLSGVTHWMSESARGESLTREILGLVQQSEFTQDPVVRGRLMEEIAGKVAQIDKRFVALGQMEWNSPLEWEVLGAVSSTKIIWSIQETHKFWDSTLKPALLKPESPELLAPWLQKLVMAFQVELSIHKELFQGKIHYLTRLQFLFGIFAFLSTVVSFLGATLVVRRILHLKGIAERIALKREPLQVEDRGHDEVASLAASFNTMTEALLSSQANLENMISNLAEMLIVTDEEGQIQRVNAAFCISTGMKEEEATGFSISGLAPGPASQQAWAQMIAKAKKQASAVRVQTTLKTKTGKVIPVAVSVTSIRRLESDQIVLVFICKDMSSIVALQKESEKRAAAEAQAKVQKEKADEIALLLEKLQTAQSQLVHSAKLASLGEMAAGVAHEINNPLAIVQGKASVLKTVIDDKDWDQKMMSDSIVQIEQTCERIGRIVEGLRLYAYENNSKDSIKLVEVSKFVQQAASLCFEQLRSEGISLEVHVDPLDLTLECHPSRISQVLMILLGNSREALSQVKEGTKQICLRVSLEGDRVVFKVEDSGPGVPVELQEKLFQPFFTTKPVGKGTGLGLSTALGLIRSEGGDLAYRRLGGMTQFVFSLPKTSVEMAA